MIELLDYLIVGKIVNTKGLLGEIKVSPMTQIPKRFDDLSFVYVEIKGEKIKYSIRSVTYTAKFVLLKLGKINTLEDAQKLKGCYLYVDRSNAIKLSEDEYFLSDIIGLDVFDINDKYLGKITEIYSPGGNDVYEITDNGKNKVLIPAIGEVIKRVDLHGGYMIIELLEGLV